MVGKGCQNCKGAVQEGAPVWWPALPRDGGVRHELSYCQHSPLGAAAEGRWACKALCILAHLHSQIGQFQRGSPQQAIVQPPLGAV